MDEAAVAAGFNRATVNLQFGHGCDAVETRPTAAARTPCCSLQFGHGCDAVETPQLPRGGEPGAQPFNSATAVMPWKLKQLAEKRAPIGAPSIRPRL